MNLKTSNSPQAFRGVVADMCHGGKIAMLGIPAKEMPMGRWQAIFNKRTLKGICGHEMHETWRKIMVILDGGAVISPVMTCRFAYCDFRRASTRGSPGKPGM
jgi:threonine 3-dehydrogenase